jgi:hypothetical protein
MHGEGLDAHCYFMLGSILSKGDYNNPSHPKGPFLELLPHMKKFISFLLESWLILPLIVAEVAFWDIWGSRILAAFIFALQEASFHVKKSGPATGEDTWRERGSKG